MDNILTNLMNLAMDNGIAVQASGDLSPDTPCAVNTKTKTILLNTNLRNKKQLAFQFAHEIGHILNGDHSNEMLYYTPTRNAIETRANQSAIKLLLPYYIDDKDTDRINLNEFMSLFAIPTHLEDIVKSEIINYLDK